MGIHASRMVALMRDDFDTQPLRKRPGGGPPMGSHRSTREKTGATPGVRLMRARVVVVATHLARKNKCGAAFIGCPRPPSCSPVTASTNASPCGPRVGSPASGGKRPPEGGAARTELPERRVGGGGGARAQVTVTRRWGFKSANRGRTNAQPFTSNGALGLWSTVSGGWVDQK